MGGNYAKEGPTPSCLGDSPRVRTELPSRLPAVPEVCVEAVVVRGKAPSLS